MKTKHIAQVLVMCGLAAPLAIHAADDRDKDRSSPKAFVKDSIITTKIKAQLAANRLSTVARVQVDADDRGAVLLTGTAKSQADADRAEAIARTVEGVVSVDNRIKVKADK